MLETDFVWQEIWIYLVDDEVYLVTALVPSETACLASWGRALLEEVDGRQSEFLWKK